MDTHARLNKQAQEKTQKQHRSNPGMLILFATLGSLVLGLIPFAYASVFGATQSRISAPVAAGEAAVWSVFGEKDTATGEQRQ